MSRPIRTWNGETPTLSNNGGKKSMVCTKEYSMLINFYIQSCLEKVERLVSIQSSFSKYGFIVFMNQMIIYVCRLTIIPK